MTHLINAEELNAQAEIAVAEKLLGISGQGVDSHSTVYDESDDGVEALIVFMDATTLEHVFLQAQRQIQREAANALGDEQR
ncbi:MAG TPA: hypothetical protein VKT82_16085 [Ktedonobacterales bacterium]|nr:hypothetical protein [Ktedonobacterales bacterium]